MTSPQNVAPSTVVLRIRSLETTCGKPHRAHRSFVPVMGWLGER